MRAINTYYDCFFFLSLILSLSLSRLSKSVGLHKLSEFQPLSTDPVDIMEFKNSVTEFQHKANITHCRDGVLCANTVSKIRRLLKQSVSAVRDDRVNTL